MQNRIQVKVNQRNPYKKVSYALKEKIMCELNCKDNAIDDDIKESIIFDLRFVCRGEK